MTLTKTIEDMVQRYAAALGEPGAPRVGDFYAEDANLLPPGPDDLTGRSAIQAFWSAATERLTDPKLTTTDVAEVGPGFAREIGTYSAQVKGSEDETVSGKYVAIWRKIDGDWKIWTDIWTSHRGQT